MDQDAELRLKRTDLDRTMRGCGVVAALCAMFGILKVMRDPYDYGARQKGLEDFFSNQGITIFSVAIALIFVGIVILAFLLRRMDYHFVVTASGLDTLGIHRPLTTKWEILDYAEETQSSLGRTLTFRNAEGRAIAQLPIDHLDVPRADILNFIRSVRPSLRLSLFPD